MQIADSSGGGRRGRLPAPSALGPVRGQRAAVLLGDGALDALAGRRPVPPVRPEGHRSRAAGAAHCVGGSRPARRADAPRAAAERRARRSR